MRSIRPHTGHPADQADEHSADATGSVAGWLERHARAAPDKPAVIHPDGGVTRYDTTTYSQLQKAVEELAQGFQGAGITRGTKSVLMAPPGPELFALAFALFRIGA
ncbi:AMP-binding protein, partial [Streptomyces erythrochromogenes]